VRIGRVLLAADQNCTGTMPAAADCRYVGGSADAWDVSHGRRFNAAGMRLFLCAFCAPRPILASPAKILKSRKSSGVKGLRSNRKNLL
jgi:hypothetical protein